MVVKKFNGNGFTIQFDDTELEYLNQIALIRKIDINDAVGTVTMTGLAMFVGFGILEKVQDADTP